ncbi:MAG: serpin family protein [Planctomycetota bacterium]|nr:serpin family protein [Planctomycetota bacterium]
MGLSSPDEKATENEKKAVVEGLNAFAASLYAKIKAEEHGNLIFSPYSISAALSMTYAGARGNTAAEMEQALQFQLKGERLHSGCGALIADLNSVICADGEPRGFKLVVANRLFGAKQDAFLPEFLGINEKLYGAPLERMDFTDATEASRKAINAWVAQKTNDRIKELIQAGQLDATTRLVLVNAIYFKSDWLDSFKKECTREEFFQLEKDGQAKTSMMNRTADLRYYEEEGKFQAVELPYKGRDLSMLVFLPARVGGLGAFEDALTGANLRKWSDGMAQEKVVLSLPKFKLTWGTKDIVNQLKELGMRDAFEVPKADFSGMNGTRTLYIAQVLCKALIEVDEEAPRPPQPRASSEYAVGRTAIGLKSFQGRPAVRVPHSYEFHGRDPYSMAAWPIRLWGRR